jgi:hypothetical protein
LKRVADLFGGGFTGDAESLLEKRRRFGAS